MEIYSFTTPKEAQMPESKAKQELRKQITDLFFNPKIADEVYPDIDCLTDEEAEAELAELDELENMLISWALRKRKDSATPNLSQDMTIAESDALIDKRNASLDASIERLNASIDRILEQLSK